MLKTVLTLALAAGLLAPSAFAARARDYLVFLEGTPNLAGISAPSSEIVAGLKAAHEAAVKRVLGDLVGFGIAETELRSLWGSNAVGVTVTPAVARELARLEGVAFVEPVRVIPLSPSFEAPRVTPEGSITWSIEKTNAPKVWNELGLDGTGVVVGHIDTGVDPNHPDLAGKILGFKDFLEPANTTAKDGQGHGTHTAGTIAGGSAGGTAIGMAPKAKLVVARVFNNQGATTEKLLQSMQWILDPDGNPATNDVPRLCSNSWGSNSTTDKSFWNICMAWRAAGCLPVFAAGNAGPGAKTVGIPGGYPHVFAVGATTNTDGIANFSSRGPNTWDGQTIIKPDVSAPGQGVYSAKDGGGYWSISGTSMACPNVAGAVALMVQKNPTMDIAAMEEALMSTARDMGPAGKDNNFGMGIIDAFAAIQSLASGGIAGKVTGEGAGALAAQLVFNGKTIQLPATGVYAVKAAPGTHSLEFKHFGYVPVTKTVTVADQTVTLDVVLAKAPSGLVSGKVKGPQGEPVAASVTALGSGLAPVQGAADGSFSIRLPLGAFTLKVTAQGYHSATVSGTLGAGGASVEVALEKAKGVLLVDDDGGANYETYYVAALEDRPGGYELRGAEGPSAPGSGADLSGYATVLWITGDKATSIKSSAIKAMTEYLAAGGKVLITGQNAAQGLKGNPFLANELGATLVNDSLKTDGVFGDGSSGLAQKLGTFAVSTGDDGAAHTTFPDAIAAAGGGAFTFARFKSLIPITKRYAGVANRRGSSASILLGFGAEGIAGAAARKQALGACLDWLQGGSDEAATRLANFRALSTR